MAISALKKKLDKVFSEFIRLRDSDENGYVRCCTCGVVKFWREVDNGHGITRGELATRFDERNCMTQCKRCNMRGGEQYLFSQEVDRRFGEGTWEELMVQRHRILKLSQSDYKEKIAYYQGEVKRMMLEKGL